MASEPGRAPARVLLIDDDRTVCQLMARQVEESGFSALTANSFPEALRLYREHRPDLVLLDVMMPTVDGFKIARMLRGEPGPFVPIILLTALDDVESKRRGMAAGADDFLIKPVSPLELQIRLSAMLRIKRLTDELDAAKQAVELLAITDPLTSLHNRRFLDQHIEREFARSKRYSHPLACLIVDIDHFKRVNDEHGHPMGDRVLVITAEVLQRSVRNTDFLARYGGEEFMVLAPETGHSTVVVLAERMRTAVPARCEAEARAHPEAGVPRCTVSIGISTTEQPEVLEVADLVRLADEQLYRSKREGRDRVSISA